MSVQSVNLAATLNLPSKAVEFLDGISIECYVSDELNSKSLTMDLSDGKSSSILFVISSTPRRTRSKPVDQPWDCTFKAAWSSYNHVVTGTASSVWSLMTSPEMVKFGQCSLFRGDSISLPLGSFNIYQVDGPFQGHWKKSFEQWDANLFVLTNDIWDALIDDGWLPEYLVILAFAGAMENNKGDWPELVLD